MIDGKWHPEGSAAQSSAILQINDDVFHLKTEDGKCYDGKVEDLAVSDRLGNIERKITLEDGSVFTTKDNDAVDAHFKKYNKASHLIHAMESSMKWVIAGLIVTIISGFSFYKWGIPWASEHIANALPQSTNNLIAADTLKFLDKYVLSKSKLPKERQAFIRAHFTKKLAPMGTDGIKYTVHFRAWNMGGMAIPNALALPSGDLILTDKFVELAKNQTEIDSVLLHEMGHVEHRHSLKMLIESTFVTVSVMMIVGDVSGVADLGIGLGTAMISSKYSRNHESEADEYAFKKMLVARMDPQAFSNIMNRMTAYVEARPLLRKKKKKGEKKKEAVKNDAETKASETKVAAKKNDKKEEKSSFMDYFSSHPATRKRVNIAQQYSACFKKGLTTCEIIRH